MRWARSRWSHSPRPATPPNGSPRLQPQERLLVFTPDEKVQRQMALVWGAEAHLVWTVKSTDDMVRQVDSALLNRGVCHPHDLVVIVAGTPPSTPGRHEQRSASTTSATSCGMAEAIDSPLLTGQAAVDGLITLLDLERIEQDIFRGVSPKDRWQRVFGGQVAGQALVAAGRTVEADRHVHSLHGYFIPSRRSEDPDRLRGRPGARRALVQHPAGDRGAAR